MNYVTVILDGYEGPQGMTGTAGGTGMNVTGPQGPISNELGPQGEIGPTGLTGPIIDIIDKTGPTGPMNSVTSTSTTIPTLTSINDFGTGSNFNIANTVSGSDTPNPITYEWIRRIHSGRPRSITTDSKGNVYIALTSNSANAGTLFDSDLTTIRATLFVQTTADIWIVKYDPFGNFIWTTSITSAGNSDNVYSLRCDRADDIYIFCSIGDVAVTSTVNFLSANGVNTSVVTNGAADSAIVKYNADGILQWFVRLASALNDNTNAGTPNSVFSERIVFDSQNNFYLTYNYRQVENYIYNTSGTTIQTVRVATGSTEESLLKFDSNGTFIWAVRMGISTVNTDSNYGICIDTIDGEDYLYVGGSSQGSATNEVVNIYNPNDTTIQTQFTQQALATPIQSFSQAYLLKFNSDGILQWYMKIAGSDFCRIFSIVVDVQHNIYAQLGNFSKNYNIYGVGESSIQATILGPVAGVTQVRCSVKYDQNGTFIRVVNIVETNSTFAGDFEFIDSDDNIYTSLTSSANAYQIYGHDATNVITFVNTTTIDHLITKWTLNGEFKWVFRIGSSGSDSPAGGMAWVDKRQNVYTLTEYPSNPINIYNTSDAIVTSIVKTTSTAEADGLFVKFKQYNTIYLHDGSADELQKIIFNSDEYRVYIDCTYYTTVYSGSSKVNCIQLTSTGSNCVLYWDVIHNVWRYSHGVGSKVIL